MGPEIGVGSEGRAAGVEDEGEGGDELGGKGATIAPSICALLRVFRASFGGGGGVGQS